MLYSLTYTELMPPTSSGEARAWFIKIRTHHKDDVGLLEHEKIHVWQFWRTLGFHGLLYKFSKRYRLKAEVEAYRKQLEYPHSTYSQDHLRDMYAGWLSASGWAEGYDL